VSVGEWGECVLSFVSHTSITCDAPVCPLLLLFCIRVGIVAAFVAFVVVAVVVVAFVVHIVVVSYVCSRLVVDYFIFESIHSVDKAQPTSSM